MKKLFIGMSLCVGLLYGCEEHIVTKINDNLSQRTIIRVVKDRPTSILIDTPRLSYSWERHWSIEKNNLVLTEDVFDELIKNKPFKQNDRVLIEIKGGKIIQFDKIDNNMIEMDVE